MKLLHAIELAKACGLTTVGEAVMNVEMHALNVFTYSEMEKEIAELKEEASKFEVDTKFTSIKPKELIKSFLQFRMYVATNFKEQTTNDFNDLLRNVMYEPGELTPLLNAYDEIDEFDTLDEMADLIHDALIDCQN